MAVTPTNLGKLFPCDSETAYSQIEISTEASHSINWEQPDAFNRHVLEFIGRY